jgi:predicted type IV restriction endonuclease
MPKAQAKDAIASLVAKFQHNLADYKRASYNETLTRIDFINPFFEALGWDMTNRQGLPENLREVIHEETTYERLSHQHLL